MGSDVAIRERTPAMVRLSSEQLQYIAHTEFVPKSMRGNLPAILACVAMGRELGLGDMVALRTINVIDGRTALSSEAMVALVRDRGHSITGNFSPDSCTVTGKRADNGDEMTVTWTTEMAREAGLLGKNNWSKYPASMLWARAVSQLCRMLFADCFAGSTHTPEEISEGDFEEFEDSAGEPQAEETTAMHGPTESTVSDASAQPSPADAPSAAQIKKLNVMVGTLREAGRITTEDVYRAANRGGVDQDGNWDFIDYISDDGELHWSPLRDSLTKPEASKLIEWLTSVEAGHAPLTIEQLNGHIAQHGVDSALVGEIGRRLFPDARGARDLSDVDRGRVWVEVEKELTHV